MGTRNGREWPLRTDPARDTISAILETGAHDGEAVVDRLIPVVYAELRRMARRHLAAEPTGHTLSTTALVHEAYLRLVDESQVALPNRAYFFGAAAQAMRRVLVDHARRHRRAKRGGARHQVELRDDHLVVDAFAADVLDLHDALDRLARVDERAARVAEWRYFGGMSTEEIASALGVSSRTVKRDWTVARAWLHQALHRDGHDAG